jgi:hypothetical protein
MKLHCRPASVILAGSLLFIGAAGTVAAPASASVPDRSTTASATGTAHAVAHSVTVHAAAAASATHVREIAGSPAMLGRDGRPTGSGLTASAATGSRPSPANRGIQAGTPNTGPSTARSARLGGRTSALARPQGMASPNASTAVGIHGVTQGGTGCSNCPTPDVTAAINTTEIAEAVNLQLQVYNRSGTSLCSVGLSSLLGALTALSGPRIQYDTSNKRFSLLIDSVPSSGTDVAVQYLATSQADDACGAWWVYSIEFPVSSAYPLGALLDYPYLGQDGTSILSSTNNYSFGRSYLGSEAYAMPKAVAYTGAAFNITTYSVAFSTAPVTVAGVPIAGTATTYWLAAVPGTGYDVYAMPTNPAGAITLMGVVRAPFSPPSRRIVQPGTSQTLDPGDGRMGSAAVQDGDTVWFAHTVDDAGFPTVQYGAIVGSTGQFATALAFDDSGSDDFNPSIAVTPAGSGTDYIWVNWAFTDTPFGVATSATVAGVAPGQGVPNLAGVDLVLVNGSPTSLNSVVGRYSSAAIDPAGTSTCPTGLTALTAQEYFNSAGQWTTQLARTTFC